MRAQIACASMILGLLTLAAAAQPAIELKAVPGSVRVMQTGTFEGADAADISCARNEYESFQVIVTAKGAPVESCDVEMTPLRKEDGAEIPSQNIALYRAVYVPVRHSSPRAACPPGLTPDPLVPFKNPYTGDAIPEPAWRKDKQSGPRFGAAAFAVFTDHHQPLWVDVHVPADAAPGQYSATMIVRARENVQARMPVRLTVWDFQLPDGPTHENHFGGVSRIANYLKLDPESPEFAQIELRYIQMLAAHRLNPPIPTRLYPKHSEDGTVAFDEQTDAGLSDFISRYHVTNIDVPRAPFNDVTGADRAKAVNYYRSWYDYLAKKGCADRAYLYMLDEPNDQAAYETVRNLGAVVKEGAPKLRRLVVEQPYTQDPDWGTLDGAVDIWCPLFGFIDEKSVQRVIKQGDDVWSYTALVQTAPSYHPEFDSFKDQLPPFWQMDFPITSYRIPTWLNRRYGITGLLYWASVYWGSPERNPWEDPGFRIRWNGEGFLIYPGNDAGIDGPIASIRLKNLRDAMEDYEYFAILEKQGRGAFVDDITRAAVPTWAAWEQDPYRLLELRRQLAQKILE